MTRTELFESAKHMAYAMANRWASRLQCWNSRKDLEQAAMLGLWEATERYEESRGKFSTFAHYWIFMELAEQWARRKPFGMKAERGLKSGLVERVPRFVGMGEVDCPVEHDDFDAVDDRDEVEHLLRRFKPLMQELVRLSWLRDVDTYDAAKELGLSRTKVRRMRHEALVLMRL